MIVYCSEMTCITQGGQRLQLVCFPWCGFRGCHGHTESRSDKLKVQPSSRWQRQIAVHVHGSNSCPLTPFRCKDTDVLICATLDPLLDSIWPVPSSYSEVHRLAFWKGHVKVICCLIRAVWPYISCHALHFPSVSHLLLQCLELFAVVSNQGTEWSRSLSWNPKKFWYLTFSERGMFVLIECLESSPMPPHSSLLCCCGTGCTHFQI